MLRTTNGELVGISSSAVIARVSTLSLLTLCGVVVAPRFLAMQPANWLAMP